MNERSASETQIIVVDDDDDVRDYLVTVLESAGFHVTALPGGIEALNAVREAAPVDLLVTDVRMPGMDGLRLARNVEHLRPGVKVLFVSGYSSRAFEEVAPDRLLRKPFRAKELLNRVKRVLAA